MSDTESQEMGPAQLPEASFFGDNSQHAMRYESRSLKRRASADIQSIFTSEIFNSHIFVIKTKNSGEKLLRVHQAVLERSPVFEAMCNRPFKEAISRTINLPEDDFFLMTCLIQYLYLEPSACSLLGTSHKTEASIHYAIDFGAQLYVLAHKYAVKGLQVMLTDELETLCNVKHLPSTSLQPSPDKFFKIARYIYENVPDADHPFRDIFQAGLLYIFVQKKDLPLIQDEIVEIMMAGGLLALDIFEVQSQAFASKCATCSNDSHHPQSTRNGRSNAITRLAAVRNETRRLGQRVSRGNDLLLD